MNNQQFKNTLSKNINHKQSLLMKKQSFINQDYLKNKIINTFDKHIEETQKNLNKLEEQKKYLINAFNNDNLKEKDIYKELYYCFIL